MPYAWYDARPKLLATSQATAGSRSGNERPRRRRDRAGCATIAYSSENPAHPVEHMLDGRCGPGATRWISARPDTVEYIVVEFDQPQAISTLLSAAAEANPYP